MMKSTDQQHFEAKVFDLTESEPKTANTSADHLKTKLEPRDIFEKSLIEAPDHLTFDKDRYLEVVEGFTPEALKNIITISRDKLRVYAVTENKITFVSCSDIPNGKAKRLFYSSFKKNLLMYTLMVQAHMDGGFFVAFSWC